MYFGVLTESPTKKSITHGFETSTLPEVLETAISTSGNWKTKRPAVKNSRYCPNGYRYDKATYGPLIGNGYAASIDDVISGQ
jgi:hypothetical protein